MEKRKFPTKSSFTRKVLSFWLEINNFVSKNGAFAIEKAIDHILPIQIHWNPKESWKEQANEEQNFFLFSEALIPIFLFESLEEYAETFEMDVQSLFQFCFDFYLQIHSQAEKDDFLLIFDRNGDLAYRTPFSFF